MTELLYYHDAYQVEFQARVVQRLASDGRVGLVLDRTCFYPTSGGQPFDLGALAGAAVEEVELREADGAVIHWLAADPGPSDEVLGQVDWARRFDHMQQHTGQHVLSQACERVAGAATVGFHMSAENSTLDLDVHELSQEQIAQAELLANQVVWQNRPVAIQFVSPAEAREMPLRKIPPPKDGQLRLVSIHDFDLSACGGTHVRQTGEIGLIKVTGSERQGGNVRLDFLCGQRALDDYDRKNRILARLSNEMTTGYWEIENSIARLRTDLKDAQRELKRKTGELIRLEAQEMAQQAVDLNGARLITRLFVDRDLGELRRLANQLAAADGIVVLFALAGDKAQLLFTRSADLDLPVNRLLDQVLPLLGEATGGGSARFAQGGGPAAPASRVRDVLEAAEERLRETLK
ncbi:MAG: alanyl-tRNA editing protein [Candidatus Promineifilaceae bacterium]